MKINSYFNFGLPVVNPLSFNSDQHIMTEMPVVDQAFVSMAFYPPAFLCGKMTKLCNKYIEAHDMFLLKELLFM